MKRQEKANINSINIKIDETFKHQMNVIKTVNDEKIENLQLNTNKALQNVEKINKRLWDYVEKSELSINNLEFDLSENFNNFEKEIISEKDVWEKVSNA